MDNAKPGHGVEFQGLTGATHLNGTQGVLVKFLKDEQRWAVRCSLDQQKVKVKAANLKRIDRGSNPSKASSPNMRGMGANSADMLANPAANAWAVGLDKKDHYEWFCNCYQMRCDDDYQWGGCYLHGPYEPQATPEYLAQDFLVFCFLAKQAKAIPDGWDWPGFLKAAPKYIAFAFEKSDAKDRWGSENYFNAQLGGRSLRFTGTMIYGSPVDRPDMSEMHERLLDEVKSRAEEMQDEVGGVAAWDALVDDLAQHSRFA